MPKFDVQLSRLVREVKVVTVDAPDQETLESNMDKVFLEANSDDWDDDPFWGAEQGCHVVIGPAPELGTTDVNLKKILEDG